MVLPALASPGSRGCGQLRGIPAARSRAAVAAPLMYGAGLQSSRSASGMGQPAVAILPDPVAR
eukprot:4832773-Alexandrium_andersonii.AAC.1